MFGCWWTARLGLVVLAFALAAGPRTALAAISSTGEVTPEPSVGDHFSVDLKIGDGSFPDDVSPFATVTVDGGSTLQYDQGYVGDDDGYFGYLTVTGPGASAEFDSSGDALIVGRAGVGYVNLTGGASLNLLNSTGDMVIGELAGAKGTVLVDGAGTYAALYDDLVVGDAGVGKLTVSGGAMMRTTTTGSDITIGAAAGGSGLMIVDGAATIFYARGSLNVGATGIGELHITNGAYFDADNNSLAQATVGTLGRLYLSEGELVVRDINVAGYLGGDGVVRGQVDVLATGDVEVNAGQRLDFEGAFNNAGAVTVTGGELRLLSTNTNAAAGRYTLEDGTVRFLNDVTNAGVIASADGVNNIHGEVTNDGTVVVASESVAVFNDAYTDNGATTVLARGNALFLSDLTFTSNSLLSLGLTSDGAAQIEVAGAATLGGELAFSFDPEFDLSVSQSIPLITADGGISGEFVPPLFPNVQGVEFGLSYGATTLSLSVTVDQNTLLDGDFNFDGVVDAADYTVWRDTLGDPQNLTIWKANYGAVAQAPVAQGSVAAPSPSAAACLLAAVVAGLAARRSRDAS
ncbi:hypothetical protein Pla123a_37040 [Posidoniimonas polymericola]|uniref:Autotransporter-associated beta strand repeat protein n=1 Tax=Posidoniimonas polymericola TaxID=2528002 RepID=A0A5C5YEP4_9BACT|nr:hypothetical protein [Posidoniimonas polymericola]TWT73810.1 hypothetical protein Pla123a_37040 [Posidoniimonas polymericola]